MIRIGKCLRFHICLLIIMIIMFIQGTVYNVRKWMVTSHFIRSLFIKLGLFSLILREPSPNFWLNIFWLSLNVSQCLSMSLEAQRDLVMSLNVSWCLSKFLNIIGKYFYRNLLKFLWLLIVFLFLCCLMSLNLLTLIASLRPLGLVWVRTFFFHFLQLLIPSF